MSTVILTRQIGHYHDARFRAAAARLGKLSVLSLANEGGFDHFLARDPGGYAIDRLFPDRKAYEAAVISGELGVVVGAALDRLAAETVVISGWAAPESFAAIRWARHNRVPLVIMSESQADDAVRSRVREALKSHIVSSCDAALVGGPPHRDYMAALGLPPARIHLGYDVVDNEHFARNADAARSNAEQLRVQHGLPNRYVLASARFVAKKNLPGLVEAYALAAHATADAPDLVILGDGEEKGAIEKAIERTGMGEHVRLPGFVAYDVLPIYYGLAEAFAQVSLVEQWGLVVNEAMAAGLPVIVSRHNGVARTVVEGENGILIDPASVPDIAAALALVFAMSPAERSAMGAMACRAIAPWGPPRFGAGLRSAIRDAHAAPCKGRLSGWDKWVLDRLAGKLIQKVA